MVDGAGEEGGDAVAGFGGVVVAVVGAGAFVLHVQQGRAGEADGVADLVEAGLQVFKADEEVDERAAGRGVEIPALVDRVGVEGWGEVFEGEAADEVGEVVGERQRGACRVEQGDLAKRHHQVPRVADDGELQGPVPGGLPSLSEHLLGQGVGRGVGVDLVAGGAWVGRVGVVRDRRQAAAGKPRQVLRLKKQRADHIAIAARHADRLLHARAANLQRLEEDEVVGVGDDHGVAQGFETGAPPSSSCFCAMGNEWRAGLFDFMRSLRPSDRLFSIQAMPVSPSCKRKVRKSAWSWFFGQQPFEF